MGVKGLGGETSRGEKSRGEKAGVNRHVASKFIFRKAKKIDKLLR